MCASSDEGQSDEGQSGPIRIWNRREKREEIEKVYGERGVELLYGNPVGQALTSALLSRRGFSQLYGAYQSSTLSRHKIAPFVREFGIDLAEYEPGPFRTFNDFFIRRFAPGARPWEQRAERMPAFAEARYLAFERVLPEQRFPVKGADLTPEELIGDPTAAAGFAGGPLLIARLCPVDYHRFHFPDDGRVLARFRVPGKLHSVNPAALRFDSRIFATNERQVSLLETRNFGRLAYIEVGALCVGKIVQTHAVSAGAEFRRGEEKGYFLFGGSTVIVLGEPGKWRPDADLLENTAQRREVLVRLGEGLATK